MASQYRLYTSNGAWPAVVDNQLEKEERKLMLLAKAFFSSFTGGESSEAVDARAAAYRRLAKEDDIESLVNGVTDQLGSLPLVEEAPVATEEARRRPAPGKTGTNAGTSTGSGN